MSALAVGLVACDDSSDLGKMQVNPQEPIFSANGITLAYPEEFDGETVDLNDFAEAGEVPVIKLVSSENLPEGGELSYVMQVAANENFDGAAKLNVTDGCVSAEELDKAVKAFYGEFAPEADVWTRFAAYYTISGQVSRLGGEDFYYAAKEVKITPVASKLPQYIYTPGNSNNWGFGPDNMTLTTVDNNKYWGYAYLDGDFKFTGQPDWNPLDWGAGDTEGVLAPKGGNLTPADGAGLYWLTLELSTLKYTMTKVSNIGIIGSFTESNWGSQINMTPSADFRTWTITTSLSGDGIEFKFRSDDNWDINLGGATDNLEWNGANISVAEAGTYTITLNLASMPYTCTIVKQ